MLSKTSNRHIALSDIDRMNGIKFEHFVGRLLEARGYTVHVTKGSNDFGVDIVAAKENVSYAIQVKRYKGKSISRQAVSDAVAGRVFYKCTKSMVVTNSYFTNGAKQFAYSVECVLIDREILHKWIEYYNGTFTKSEDRILQGRFKKNLSALLYVGIVGVLFIIGYLYALPLKSLVTVPTVHSPQVILQNNSNLESHSTKTPMPYNGLIEKLPKENESIGNIIEATKVYNDANVPIYPAYELGLIKICAKSDANPNTQYLTSYDYKLISESEATDKLVSRPRSSLIVDPKSANCYHPKSPNRKDKIYFLRNKNICLQVIGSFWRRNESLEESKIGETYDMICLTNGEWSIPTDLITQTISNNSAEWEVTYSLTSILE